MEVGRFPDFPMSRRKMLVFSASPPPFFPSLYLGLPFPFPVLDFLVFFSSSQFSSSPPSYFLHPHPPLERGNTSQIPPDGKNSSRTALTPTPTPTPHTLSPSSTPLCETTASKPKAHYVASSSISQLQAGRAIQETAATRVIATRVCVQLWRQAVIARSVVARPRLCTVRTVRRWCVR